MVDKEHALPPGGEQTVTPGTGASVPGVPPTTNDPTQGHNATLSELTTQPALAAITREEKDHWSSSFTEQTTRPSPAMRSVLVPTNEPAPPVNPTAVIVVRDLVKTYILGGKTQVPALRGVSLTVHSGEFVAIMGPSGSGKSTFMNLIGCLDRPTSGEYWLAGKLVSSLSNDELAGIRNRLIGFVFQGFNLLGRATAIKNVALPMIYSGLPGRERERRARKVLQLVGLGGRERHKPSELSGGQQQRVAVARALINGPALLLADEPTGNLDSHTSIEIMAVLQALNEQGLTIVLVTHDLKIAQYAKRQVSFLDGQIIHDEISAAPRQAIEEWEALHNTPTVQDNTSPVQVKEETP